MRLFNRKPSCFNRVSTTPSDWLKPFHAKYDPDSHTHSHLMAFPMALLRSALCRVPIVLQSKCLYTAPKRCFSGNSRVHLCTHATRTAHCFPFFFWFFFIYKRICYIQKVFITILTYSNRIANFCSYCSFPFIIIIGCTTQSIIMILWHCIFPGLRYSKSHEWVRADGGTYTVGLSKYAVHSLGDVVYVELPDPGTQMKKDGELDS